MSYRFFLTIILAVGLLVGSGMTTSSSSVSAEDSAAAMLETAAQSMLALDSFHFVVSTPVGKTSYADLVELDVITGDVLRPNSFQTEFSVSLAFVKLNLSAIGIGSDIWVTDPLNKDGGYIQVAGGDANALPPLALLNPDELIQTALAAVQDPTVSGEAEINGESTTVITGSIDPSQIFVEGTPVPDDFLANLGPIGITFWVNDQNQIVRLELEGAFLPGEDPDAVVVRRIDISGFNEPVEISAPAPQEAN
jgi:LppX_LprAFG lipoprotein